MNGKPPTLSEVIQQGKSSTQAWKVILNGRHVNTVFFIREMPADEVRNSLIDHDGYPNNIEVRK